MKNKLFLLYIVNKSYFSADLVLIYCDIYLAVNLWHSDLNKNNNTRICDYEWC